MTHDSNPPPLVLERFPTGTTSVDLLFDDMRVWSVDVRDVVAENDQVVFEWPDQLTPYLTGSTFLRVLDSSSGIELESRELSFDDSEHRTEVANSAGVPLVVNKWWRLAPDLSGMGRKTRQRIVKRSAKIVDQLAELGLRPFVVGGTLLGGVREGTLLPHDDDADIAYLSRHTNPADVAREAFWLGNELEKLGYEFRRHSAAHIQISFEGKRRRDRFYIDVFTAFFTEDGNINQPFHVRGEMNVEQMLPFGSVTIDGIEFPAPADVDRWLTINYDENWREPIPGFRLITPEATRRRFDGWFGGFNFQREFWDDWFENADAVQDSEIWETGALWLSEQALKSPALLDLGSGAGQVARRLRAHHEHLRIVACDYSPPALRLLRAHLADDSIETAHLNLYRMISLSLPARLGITGEFDVVANHVLEQIGHLGRANALRLIRMSLRSGGSAAATLHGAPAPDVNAADPTTWHLSQADLQREAAAFGLHVSFSELDATDAEHGRHPYGARFTLEAPELPREDPTMKQKLKRLISRAAPQTATDEIETLRARVEALETELVELRHDSLRIAELIDLAELSFTPGEANGAPRPDRPASD